MNQIETENLDTPNGKKAEACKKKKKVHILPALIFTTTMAIGAFVCCTCDMAFFKTLTWSLVPLSSILFTWLVSLPAILLGKRGMLPSLITFSVLAVPFIYSLSVLLGVKQIFSVGSAITVIALVYMWITFFLYHALKERALMATGIALLIGIPFVFIINVTLSMMLGTFLINTWNFLTVFILLVMAIIFFAAEHAHSKRLTN